MVCYSQIVFWCVDFVFFDVTLFDNTLDSYFKNSTQEHLAKVSVVFAVLVSVFLIIIKVAAWLITDSISMQASLNDSCLDALSSFIAFHALNFSNVRYDDVHNFGHEKVEGIVAIFQCIIVAYSGLLIFRESYEMFLHPKPVENTGVGIAVMAVSCVSVYLLLYLQRYVAIRTDSLIVKGDSLHYLSDLLTNLCVAISLILSNTFIYMDVLCGLTVCCFVMYNVFVIFRSALSDLMDESLPQKIRQEIELAILATDGVKSLKILKTRSAGMKKYVESTVGVDHNFSIVEADIVSKNAECDVKKLLGNADILIKVEPQ
ncbi:MAG: cation diffusion facilitator family transporter [Holosporaceae bacterium]|nr:cation diffusion facilitator family transporter [Holosporaceae bacterium]